MSDLERGTVEEAKGIYSTYDEAKEAFASLDKDLDRYVYWRIGEYDGSYFILCMPRAQSLTP